MELAAALSRSPQTCKRSLNELKQAGMIMRVRQEPIMQRHDLSGKERFRPETRHMITLEVQKDCFVGFKGSGSVSTFPMRATGMQNTANRREKSG